MAIPRKPWDAPRRRRRLQDKLKNSALFILTAVLFAAVDIFSFVVWLSQLLSGRGNGKVALTLWVATTAFFAVVWILVALNNRRLGRKEEPSVPAPTRSARHP